MGVIGYCLQKTLVVRLDKLHILVFYIICLLTCLHIKVFVLVKQKISYINLTLIPCERKPFWQLRRLDDILINAIANLYIHERLKIPEAYSEPCQKSKMELSVKII